MNYREYIVGDTKVSEIGLGSWQLGIDSGWKLITENNAIKIVEKAIDLGVNFFDTAPCYGNGSSEERLGRALEPYDRNKIVISTKFGRDEHGNIDFSSTKIVNSVESSLKRLRTDYLDSVILHSPPIEILDGNKNDHYEIFEKLISEGKIKAYGASIDTSKEIDLLLNTTNSKIIQAFYNIFHQDVKRSFKSIYNHKVGLVVKVPLDSGWLTGKYNNKSSFTGVRDRWSKDDIALRSKLVDRLYKLIGDDYSLKKVALRFCLSNNSVSTVIPGVLSIDQLNNNIIDINDEIPSDLINELYDLYNSYISKFSLPW